jgi:hypothetical protein
MVAILAWWGGSAVVLIALALLVGHAVTQQWLGLLIDSRGRYSLTHLQLSLWTIVILSLLAGVFFGRWQHNVDPLGFSVPAVVLGLLGISVGSAVTVTAAKVAKNTTRPANVAAAAPGPWRPSLIQIFLQEEGTYADQVIDITKFQNFVITVVLVLAYIGLAVHTITAAGDASKVTALPGFSGTFLVLLGISHAAYLAGKLPSPDGQPAGLSVASRDVMSWAAARSAASAGQPVGRPGRLWRYDAKANVNVWSDGAPLAAVPAGETLVVADTRPFVLHWTADNWQPAHVDTALQLGSGRYAVMFPPSELARSGAVQFTRRYLDRPAATASNNGWEGTPATNHVVRLEVPGQ